MSKSVFFFVLVVLTIFLASGCMKKEILQKPFLQKLSPSDYPDFIDDLDYAGLESGIEGSLIYLRKVPPDRNFSFGTDTFSVAHMIRSLQFFRSFLKTKPSQNKLRDFIKRHYSVYQSTGSDSKGDILFTGYYEPLLYGSLARSPEYRFPVYAKPDDLVTINLSLFASRFKGEKVVGRFAGDTVLPYYNRSEINTGNYLEAKAKVLAWVNDRVALFFLHIQGSGKVQLDNGEIINVHYHTTNGRPYRSIGKFLIETGRIPASEMSMQRIREYLHHNPEQLDAVLNYNPSYIFFKTEEKGPVGYLGVKLVAGRSIASDRKIFPLGAMAFIETEKPLIDDSGKVRAWTDCSRFVLNHDTGGAIKGPARVDLFWGNGRYAEIAAGHMKQTGRLFFLVLNKNGIRVKG